MAMMRCLLIGFITILSRTCKVSGGLCDDEINRSTVTTPKPGYRVCCKVHYREVGYTISRRSCSTGCCGSVDDQDCCPSENNKALPYIIGFSLFGALVFIGVTILLVWVFRKACRAVKDYSGHKKLLQEVYAAETLEDLFLPDQPLVSAPGTIIHPMTNINGPFFTMEEQAYVVPDYTHPGAAAIPPPSRPRHRDNDDDDDEANWDRLHLMSSSSVPRVSERREASAHWNT